MNKFMVRVTLFVIGYLLLVEGSAALFHFTVFLKDQVVGIRIILPPPTHANGGSSTGEEGKFV